MQKKEKVVIALVILFLLVIAGSYTTIAVTYAKYVSSIRGSGTTTVAKWEWRINGAALTKGSTTFTMNLFEHSTLLDNDCTKTESDIVATDGIIAPGTCGMFEIKLKNTSEVDATYTYDLTLTNEANIPLEFSTDKTSWKTIDEFDVNTKTDINMNATSTNAPIYWRWVFEKNDGDAKDTELGFDGTATATIIANLTLEQKD